MIERGQQQAKLTLNPPELGTVNVQIEINQNEVKINLITQTSAARESLDAALPCLRELITEQGMNLTHADVSQQHGHETQSKAFGQDFGQTESVQTRVWKAMLSRLQRTLLISSIRER